MRVIVAGSRNVTDYAYVKNAIKIYNQNVKGGITEIISGGARGVDKLGERAARELGIPVKIFKANWNEYGKRAGMIRNEEMLAYGDALIAIWDGNSRGTGNMIRITKSAGKQAIVLFHNTNHSIWNFLGIADSICITTNGFCSVSGKAVMGRGNAFQATCMLPGIEYALGKKLNDDGNITQIVTKSGSTHIIAFPVKPTNIVYDGNNIVAHAKPKYKVGDRVPGFYAKADIKLIERSAAQLASIIDKGRYKTNILPCPGIGAGELNIKEVLPVLKKYLSGKVTVATYKELIHL